MDFLRPVQLPSTVPGRPYLCSMPGRYQPLETCFAALRNASCSLLVCLAPREEIRQKSPGYLHAIASETLPCEQHQFPIADYQAPRDIAAFARSVRRIADALRSGNAVAIHCGAGIGRTGTFAIGVLVALGLSIDEAAPLVSKAGSGPEREEQRESLRQLTSTISSQTT